MEDPANPTAESLRSTAPTYPWAGDSMKSNPPLLLRNFLLLLSLAAALPVRASANELMREYRRELFLEERAARYAADPPANSFRTLPYWQWPEHPHVPTALRIAVDHGFLPQTPFTNYLKWRQSLDPARFDYYHPRVAYLLSLENVSTPAIVSTPVVPPVVQPQAQTITPPPLLPPQAQTVVPEPGSLSVALAMIASAAAARSWRRGRESLEANSESPRKLG